MIKIKYYITILVTFVVTSTFAQITTNVDHFNKAIISPNIQVTFVEGNEESVTIENSTVDRSKINIEVNNKTLRIYLDGAKDIPKNKTDYSNGYKEKHSIYTGTVVTAIVTYKTLDDLSVRGEETIVCESLLKGDKFRPDNLW